MNRLIVTIPGASEELLAEAIKVATAHFEARGVLPLEAAAASYLREGLPGFGRPHRYNDAAADAWEHAGAAICAALGVTHCRVDIPRGAQDDAG